MKALILSVSAGAGHINAAEALKSYIMLNEPNSEVKIIDTLKHINPIIDKVVIGSYLKAIKTTPSLFGKLYDFAESDDALAAVSNKVNEILSYKLVPLIRSLNPDILICTHPFPTEMISTLKKKGKITIPLATILTDYAAHSFWIHKKVDAYIVSNSDMIDQMASRGVDKNIVYDLGIPVKPSFMATYEKEAIFKELQFNPSVPTILVMGGSLGMGKIEEIFEELLKINKNVQILAITGNNKKLFSELNKITQSSDKPVKIIGYTNEVNKYMQCCDLLITKPGGLTITEAIICKTPLALFSPIPGQEEKNADFLIKHNLAITLGDGRNSSNAIEKLISSPEELNEMKQNCEKFSKPSSGKDIYVLLKTLIEHNDKLNKKTNPIKY